MKVRRFADEQMIPLLQQAERCAQPIGLLCREHGISEQTFSRWRKQFGGMPIPDTQRLRGLEQENGRLTRLLAERDLAAEARRALLAKTS
jgi:putative transposase